MKTYIMPNMTFLGGYYEHCDDDSTRLTELGGSEVVWMVSSKFYLKWLRDK